MHRQINIEIIAMTNMQRQTLMATALILGASVLPSAGAQQTYQVPVLLLGTDVLRLAEAEQTYGIRPAADAAAPSSSPEAPAGSSMERSSEIQNDGGIRYVSGGVGESERTELNALSSQFNLHLMFATQGGGEYLSAVRVNILDAHGQPVLTAQSKGPWFYAQLPSGDYQVEVTPTEGRTGRDQPQRKSAHINGSGHSTLDFYWEKAR